MLTQKLKRKNQQIRRLKAERTETAETSELQRVRQRLKNCKRQCQHLQSKCANAVHTDNTKLTEMMTRLRSRDDYIRQLENDKLLALEERVDAIGVNRKMVKPGKAFHSDMRQIVYDGIVNQVPTQNIPVVISRFATHFCIQVDSIPHRSTVEMIAREIGVIADLQAAEALISNNHLTLGFDATTQERVHLNSIHVTSESHCYVLAIDELPGGTAVDYSTHICQSIDHLASLYSNFTHSDSHQCRAKMISNVTTCNCMTDRAAANHATIVLVNEAWEKTLNELNCHLHPLDTIASSARSALKQLETVKGKLFGTDCVAGNLVIQLNKLRFKDGKGDPRGFKAFLKSEHLPSGFIPRYRGNRLHILFDICGKYFAPYDAFLRFLMSGTVACGGLTTAICHDFTSATGKCELHVLGLFGKMFTGPWMKRFYTSSATSQITHIEGIGVAKAAVNKLKQLEGDAVSLLTSTHDLLGDMLDVGSDTTLQKLRHQPDDVGKFVEMMKAVMAPAATVLERQYKRYFNIETGSRGNAVCQVPQH